MATGAPSRIQPAKHGFSRKGARGCACQRGAHSGRVRCWRVQRSGRHALTASGLTPLRSLLETQYLREAQAMWVRSGAAQRMQAPTLTHALHSAGDAAQRGAPEDVLPGKKQQLHRAVQCQGSTACTSKEYAVLTPRAPPPGKGTFYRALRRRGGQHWWLSVNQILTTRIHRTDTPSPRRHHNNKWNLIG